MKIGIVSDTHGGHNNEALHLEAFIKDQNLEAVLQVGDFGLYEWNFKVPVYWVYGNREYASVINQLRYQIEDLKQVLSPSNNWILDLEPIVVGPLTIVGINGAEEPKGDGYIITRNMSRLEEQARELTGKVDIVISHETPIKKVLTSDYNGKICETQSDNVRKLVEIIQPKFAFSGHWHKNLYEEFIIKTKRDFGDIGVNGNWASYNFKSIFMYCLGIEPKDWLILDTETMTLEPWR